MTYKELYEKAESLKARNVAKDFMIWNGSNETVSDHDFETVQSLEDYPDNGYRPNLFRVVSHDDSGHIALPMVVAGIALYIVWFMFSHGIFQAVTALQHGR